jgi:hypothetical protein
MSNAAAVAKPVTVRLTEVSNERAYEIIASMSRQTEFENAAMLIVSGNCAEYGDIHVIIPPLGDAILLPFAIQSAAL